MNGGFNEPEFAAGVQTQHPRLVVEVVKRLDQVPGFHVLPKRWVIERTFGWLMHCRRLDLPRHDPAHAPPTRVIATQFRFFRQALEPSQSVERRAPSRPVVVWFQEHAGTVLGVPVHGRVIQPLPRALHLRVFA